MTAARRPGRADEESQESGMTWSDATIRYMKALRRRRYKLALKRVLSLLTHLPRDINRVGPVVAMQEFVWLIGKILKDTLDLNVKVEADVAVKAAMEEIMRAIIRLSKESFDAGERGKAAEAPVVDEVKREEGSV